MTVILTIYAIIILKFVKTFQIFVIVRIVGFRFFDHSLPALDFLWGE